MPSASSEDVLVLVYWSDNFFSKSSALNQFISRGLLKKLLISVIVSKETLFAAVTITLVSFGTAITLFSLANL